MTDLRERVARAIEARVLRDGFATHEELADAAMAAMQGGRVPDGWQLVPVKSTGEMMEAADDEWRCSRGDPSNEALWAAMLAAAPTPPSQTEKTDHA